MTDGSIEGRELSGPPTKTRILLGLASLGLLIGVFSIAASRRGDGPDGGGPLAPELPGVTMRGTTAEIGDRVTFGGITLVNTGSRERPCSRA